MQVVISPPDSAVRPHPLKLVEGYTFPEGSMTLEPRFHSDVAQLPVVSVLVYRTTGELHKRYDLVLSGKDGSLRLSARTSDVPPAFDNPAAAPDEKEAK